MIEDFTTAGPMDPRRIHVDTDATQRRLYTSDGRAEDFYELGLDDVVQYGDLCYPSDGGFWRYVVDSAVGMTVRDTLGHYWFYRRKPEVKESLTTAAEPSLLEAVDAFIAAMNSQAGIPEAEDQKILDQAYEALVLAADVARGKA